MNRAIDRMRALVFALFCVLVARQFWLQVIAAPRLAEDPRNPRSAVDVARLGPILARDGTLLAYSDGGTRRYPLGGMLAQTVGYVSKRYGSAGLEAALATTLAPPQAQSWNPIAQLRGDFSPSAAASRGVVTTIDPMLERTLAGALAPYRAAAAIALDPQSGAVLAIASRPTFDPASIDAEFSDLASDRDAPFIDRPLAGLYPPGSTFKIFTASAALEAGAVAPDATFYDPGTLSIGNAVIHDNEGEATGRQTLAGAFALSSNVDFARIAIALGPARWFAAAQRFGLGPPPPFELPVESDRLPPPSVMTPSVLGQLGFGQADLLVTPLRMALLTATIADGGRTPLPRILRSTPPATLARPISASTAATVAAMMVAVVQRGTGRSAAISGITVAGKTGTATNPSGRAHAWFVAFAPVERPRIVVAVVVEHGGYGGSVAAPIARRIMVAALTRPPLGR